jgi:hypothetical protein
MKPLFNDARIKEVADFIRAELHTFLDQTHGQSPISIALRERCAAYSELTNGETRLAILQGLAFASIEIGDDFAGLLYDETPATRRAQR